MKDTLPMWKVNAGQTDCIWAEWVLKQQRSSRADQKPQHPCTGFMSAACSQQGPHIDEGSQSDHVSLVGGQWEPAGIFSQNQVSWMCNHNNYQDLFLLPLSPARSSCCNICFLAETYTWKTGMNRNEVIWEKQGSVSFQVTCREHLLTGGTSAASKFLLRAEAWGCSWPPLSLDAVFPVFAVLLWRKAAFN